MIINLILKIILSFVTLLIGNKIISSGVPGHKLLGIAVLGQLFIMYVLDYVMAIAGLVPIPHMRLVLQIVTWVGLANFVVPKTTPKEYFFLGFLTFLVNYVIGYFGLLGLI